MIASVETVPIHPISHQLIRFIYVSMGLSIVILICSLTLLGYTSFWLSEAGFTLTMIHHGIILHDRWKQQKAHSLGTTGGFKTFPASSTKPSIFAAWFIALVWVAALGIVTMFTIITYGPWAEGWDNRSIAIPFELGCLVLEASLTVVIAVWCIRERRFVLGVAQNRGWYHLS